MNLYICKKKIVNYILYFIYLICFSCKPVDKITINNNNLKLLMYITINDSTQIYRNNIKDINNICLKINIDTVPLNSIEFSKESKNYFIYNFHQFSASQLFDISEINKLKKLSIAGFSIYPISLAHFETGIKSSFSFDKCINTSQYNDIVHWLDIYQNDAHRDSSFELLVGDFRINNFQPKANEPVVSNLKIIFNFSE